MASYKMILTPEQASEIIGVPAVQLCRWAYLGQGPRNSGTKHKPMFDEDDLMKWKNPPFWCVKHGPMGVPCEQCLKS